MSSKLEMGMAKAGLNGAMHHLFLCIGPDCCQSQEGEALWEHAKARVKESGLPVMRTKAGCFRICAQGPWLVVYPDGVWYREMTPERFDRILQEHVLGGRVVREWVAAVNPLGTPAAE
jgi:(2Fe-2S) ferredoxin